MNEEELHKAKSGRGPSTGASVSMKVGCVTLPVFRCVHHPGSSQNPILLGSDGCFLK